MSDDISPGTKHYNNDPSSPKTLNRAWDKKLFLKAWVANQNKSWDDFYKAMVAALKKDVGPDAEITEFGVSARLGSYTRWLNKAGFQAPKRPERPPAKKETLADIAEELGLDTLDASKAKDAAALNRAKMKVGV